MDKFDKKLLYSLLVFMSIMILQNSVLIAPSAVQGLFFLSACLFIVIFVVYCLAAASKKEAYFSLLSNLFYIYLAVAILSIVVYSQAYNILFELYTILYQPAAYFALYIAIFFLMSLGTYLIYTKKYKIGIAVFVLVFLIVLFYYTSANLVSKNSNINDEELISIFGMKSLLSGGNPYTMNISNVLYYSDILNKTGYSLTSNNTIIGTMDYPSLFFLSIAPFYLLSQPTIKNIIGFDFRVEVAVALLILLLSVWYVMDKKDIMKPKYLLFCALIFFIPNILSITTFLMLAIIVLAYAKLDSKYSWILLGLALSIQEELWFPVILLIAYSFNTYGFRKGVKDAVGAAAVFLLFNGYFILLNPAAYLNDVIIPVGQAILPTFDAAIGYFIFSQYTIPLPVYSLLFDLALLAALFISVYFNDKKIIPILSFIPLLFLSHSLLGYYYLFAAMFVITIYMKPEKRQIGSFRKYINENLSSLPVFAAVLALIFIAAAAIVFHAHSVYVNTVNFSISDQSAYVQGNNLYYNSTLSYNSANAVDGKLYLLLYVNGYSSKGVVGIENTSLLKGSMNCSFPCSININRIMLNQSSHTYQINVVAHNITGMQYVSVMLYNGDYAYASEPVKVMG